MSPNFYGGNDVHTALQVDGRRVRPGMVPRRAARAGSSSDHGARARSTRESPRHPGAAGDRRERLGLGAPSGAAAAPGLDSRCSLKMTRTRHTASRARNDVRPVVARAALALTVSVAVACAGTNSTSVPAPQTVTDIAAYPPLPNDAPPGASAS